MNVAPVYGHDLLSFISQAMCWADISLLNVGPTLRLGDEERRLMNLVPAPAVRLMKRRVLSRPGLNSPLALVWIHRLFIPQVTIDPLILSLSLWWVNK